MTASRISSEIKNPHGVAESNDLVDEKWSRWNVGRIRLFGIFVHFKFFVLLLVELGVIAIATYYCYSQAALQNPQAAGWLWAKSLFAAGPFILCFAGLGLYSSRQTLTVRGVLLRYIVASAVALPMLWILHLFLNAYVTAVDFIGPVAVAILILVAFRVLISPVLNSNLLQRRIMVVGNGQKVSFIERIASDPNQRGFTLSNAKPDLSTPGALVNCVKRHRINEVVVAFDDRRNTLPAKELLDCRLSGVSVVDVLDFLERETGVIPFEHLQPSWLIFTDGFSGNIFSQLAKRTFDILASVALIVVSIPILLISATAIKLDRRSPGPILYRQTRVGLLGKQFEVLKFRSMRTDAEKNGEAKWATQNDTRITAVGAVLRKYRIDELPQLFNVLAGTMSLVGPRPERPVFVSALSNMNDLYTERHRVKPGVTGWAQLRFPYTDNTEDSILKLQYDMYYLKNQGFVFDFYILLQTLEVVLFGKGSR